MSPHKPEQSEQADIMTNQQVDILYRPRLIDEVGREEPLAATDLVDLRERYCSVDVEAALEDVRFFGFAQLPFEFSEDELRDHIRRNVPPLAVTGVESIGFVHDIASSERDLKDDTAMNRGYHFYDQDKDASRIGVMIEPLRILAELGSPEIAKRAMLSTLYHEMGHGLAYRLSPELLKRWHRAVAKDPTHISDYVAQHYQAGSKLRYAEDFAESFAFFICRQEQLLASSTDRFFGMYDIFGHTRAGHMTASELLQEIDRG